MSTATTINRIPELRRAVRQARDDAFLVEPRVVRRIIRELHGFARLSTRIPHTEVLVVRAFSVKTLAHPDELGLENFDSLPNPCILVAQPEEHEFEQQSIQDLLLLLWKRLFHGCIDIELRRKTASGALSREAVHGLIDRLGQVEFDEAHAVIRTELRLIDPNSRTEAFCEFCAVYQQMVMFSPDLLPVWFPSLADAPAVLSIISEYADGQRLFEDSRLYGAPEPDLTSGTAQDEKAVARERESWTDGLSLKPSSGRHARLLKAHDRWSERGNTVAAAVLAMRAAESATTDSERQQASQLAEQDIGILAARLCEALNFDEADLDDWEKSLGELLKTSVLGFWNSDKRLLYDLQNVCLDHERTIYQVDLVKWIVSRGRRPLRRPLTNIREVMMAKHLARCAARLVAVRLSGEERERLSRLLYDAANLAEDQMRLRLRSTVQETIRDVGFSPQSVPEQVAFDKMIEESLDCITERGYLTMGYLRDAISRNDLKLPDLTGPRDLVRGDHLLRTDDRLDVSLDGVYRRGEFYMRWLQVISSLAFGTRKGRFLTLFVAIPFGGAVVIVVGTQHIVAVATGAHHDHDSTAESAIDETLPDASDDTATKPEETSDTDEAASVDGEGESGPGENGEGDPATADDAVPLSEVVAVSDPGDGDPDDGESAESTSADSSSTPVRAELKAFGEESTGDSETAELVEVTPNHPVYAFIEAHNVSLTLVVGILLMALIHLPTFRRAFQAVTRQAWILFRKAIYDIPLKLLKLPLVQKFWRSRWFVWFRRHVTNPLLVVTTLAWLLPVLLGRRPLDWWLIGTISFLLSWAVNSRLGRDAEELTAEWLANAWHDLRSRFLMALLDWIIDFFKWLLNLLERFIYAVDEWLRFHSGETWLSVVVKAVVGVVWSFVSFLLRIYVNLLIEPTLHPVKHFPVVTVAHKIFLPGILILEHNMRETLAHYLWEPLSGLAGPITWFNIVFLPGIFGFLVWELKENWRLYASNRVPTLQPVVIGSHGENGGRMLKPGFHSGTLPKLFHHLRKTETKQVSYHRFRKRRALGEALEHHERDIRRFVERDLICLLSYCRVWDEKPVTCLRVRAASNSFLVELGCNSVHDSPLHLLFQEQSGWLVATISSHGWLDQATPEMQHSFETALRGFYNKAGVDLVREQLERQLIGSHPYDIRAEGLVIWPDRRFHEEITVDLHRRHQIRPVPISKAASYGLQPVSRDAVVFSERQTLWNDWKHVWATPNDSESSSPLPLACMQSARASLIAWRR